MAIEETTDETTVTDSGTATVPAAIRDRLDIEPGDKLRWHLDDDGVLAVEIVHQREGVFDDVDAVDAGETDAVEVEREFGAE
jgi:AbrB family looped-hinge helix DNA binding protein